MGTMGSGRYTTTEMQIFAERLAVTFAYRLGSHMFFYDTIYNNIGSNYFGLPSSKEALSLILGVFMGY